MDLEKQQASLFKIVSIHFDHIKVYICILYYLL